MQALAKQSELAVTTSTRNWFRALGSAVGVAVATAVQFTVTIASLPADLPPGITSAVRGGTWQIGDTPAWDDAILDAKMKGIHSVFVVFVPLIALCLVGCIWIKGIPLLGDDESGGKKFESRLIAKLSLGR